MPPSSLVRTSPPAMGGRLLRSTKQRRQTGRTIINAISNTPTSCRGVHVHVHVPVHGFMYASGPSYSGLIAEATMRKATIAITGDRNSSGRRNGEISHSCIRTPQAFDMHEYLRSLMVLYRKCTGSLTTTAFSSSQSRPDEGETRNGSSTCPRPESERQTLLSESAVGVPRNNAHSPPPLSVSCSAGDVAAHHRRSYSTSATLFASSAAPSSLSSSSSSPSNTNNDNTNRKSNTSPIGTGIDFDRLSTIIPDQSAAGVNSLWYIVATASLLAFHKEAAVGELWKYISQRCEAEGEVGGVDATTRQLSIARRIRESCLKASVLVGFPRGINALLSLQSSLSTHNPPSFLTTLKSDKPLRTLSTFPSAEERYARGKHFFTQIYANHTERVLSSMSASSAGDLSYFAVSSIYGELMAEMSILDGRETVLLEFVCCLADGVGAQAKGHFFGCRNLGVTGPEIRGAIEIVREIAGQLGLVSFLENVKEEEGAFRFLKKASTW
ncbi:hypothetical protein GX50_01395 [[Emmonsia] crescens]|uniref:Carboxymuconolactone decarboxylase-like domain-containing protein n=1 Tax=[Emmonsia] crescens TaxID=73230 RepID=A0A2B7ZR02_9EURO|nr:hypothetical protein GX50_01395 [Emmonsia crescens]